MGMWGTGYVGLWVEFHAQHKSPPCPATCMYGLFAIGRSAASEHDVKCALETSEKGHAKLLDLSW